jgi:hypothetical protein
MTIGPASPSSARGTAAPVLDDRELAAFRNDGYLVVPSFYEVERDIEPIWAGIYDIIGLVAEEHGISLHRHRYSPETFDDGYAVLKAVDRSLAASVYDAVKQLAPFVRLTSLPRNADVFSRLRETDAVGIAGGGSGLRIDNPDETQYLAWWHQEYPAQLRSLDGVVFWSPLRRLTPELGPVEILPGSHREGPIPVHREDGTGGRKDAYALRLHSEADVVARYPKVVPLSQPGDLVLIDFLTVHRSGVNRTRQARWTMQWRYFNFREATGRRIGWSGSFAAGRDPSAVQPGLEVAP